MLSICTKCLSVEGGAEADRTPAVMVGEFRAENNCGGIKPRAICQGAGRKGQSCLSSVCSTINALIVSQHYSLVLHRSKLRPAKLINICSFT